MSRSSFINFTKTRWKKLDNLIKHSDIDNVLFINNLNFSDRVPLIYYDINIPVSSASFLILEFDKKDNFNLEIIKFLHLSSNIPTSAAYAKYIFQLIRYSRGCSCYSHFVKRYQCLSRTLMNQGYLKERLVLLLKKFIGRYQDLVDKYSVSTSQKIHDGLDALHI